MKKIFYAVLFSALVVGLYSCSNGDYQADPTDPANNGINPITPLTESQFTWYNKDVLMAADINGSRWEADHVSFAIDTSGSNVLIGTKDGSPVMLNFYLKDVWGGNLYSMELDDFDRFGAYIDSNSIVDGPFYSYLSNSGGLLVKNNDTDVINGAFYFKGVSVTGKAVTITNGVFNVYKP